MRELKDYNAMKIVGQSFGQFENCVITHLYFRKFPRDPYGRIASVGVSCMPINYQHNK